MLNTYSLRVKKLEVSSSLNRSIASSCQVLLNVSFVNPAIAASYVASHRLKQSVYLLHTAS